MSTRTRLVPRSRAGVTERLARSAATPQGAHRTTAETLDWLGFHRVTCGTEIRRIPFAKLDNWSFAPDTGDLRHSSGAFFTVEGLHVTRPDGTWQQPIIVQPEIGILGILAKEFDGVLHFLMQAKMEPGNPDLVQLSPTVQATRSNYTKAHGGAAVKYLEHFLEPDRDRVLTDVLQSEHGAWFYRKRNRNMIVEVDAGVPVQVHDGFAWLTLGQIVELLCLDNVVNMDARTVLASAPMAAEEAGALTSDAELLAWFTGERARQDVRTRRMPLREISGWRRDTHSIRREDERFFRVVAVSVKGAGREVRGWTQPIIEPVGPGLVAFAYRMFDGLPHVLVHARVEGGFLDTAELAPTVQCVPSNYAHLPDGQRPAFLDLMLNPSPERIRYSTVHSEEGGRFLDAESRYLIVETDEATTPAEAPPGFHWVSTGQLNWLAGHSRYVNVQARTLLAVLTTAGAGTS
ncbi:NDP-hexose 2,3-dehydratase family protein [Streptomyces brevispora]|uniref:NDP-hexose 2,3-dehydratase family protein n=1 Tax=Streptomyces brevispora TaxID=887462 RepID=A0A561TYB5_9ACTN|nr:NDP-hexose 2,3-dehydratase family protein [Streptomyces brevispora]TWF92109.1 oxidase EvaA [Streptomyces brevispora]WSC11587.1 NDP-hexose 2,3-dehydratase family protein [Streptomyces brevispora]WSC17525.1 NDP-hexose 2,3-dehydratase family protein [Streptomyces brevispora]